VGTLKRSQPLCVNWPSTETEYINKICHSKQGNNLVNNVYYVSYLQKNTHGLTTKVVVTNKIKKGKVYNHYCKLF